MKLHTITNSMAHWFISRNDYDDWRGYHDDCGGFGHIDMGDFDYTKEVQVVERLVDVPNATYYIRVVGAYDSLSEAYDEINFRRDYCFNYACGCHAEYELWSFSLARYRWYFGEDAYDRDELPDYICHVLVAGEPDRSFYFDDPSEWGEYTGQLLSAEGYILLDVRVLSAEISYLDQLTEELIPKRLVKRIPCVTHVVTRN